MGPYLSSLWAQRAEDEAVSVPKAVPILGAHVEDQKSKSLPRAVKESRQLEKEGM